MPIVTHAIEIAAPVERVYAFIADRPEAAASFIPGLNRISNVSSPAPGIGQTWEYEFNWFGLVISGQSRCSNLDRPRSYQFQTLSGTRSTWSYRFEPKDAKTRLSLEVEYEIPKNVLARYASQGALEKMNQDRAVEALANLKGLLEA
jgi:carbon monoxide dehydrogenase subunit G